MSTILEQYAELKTIIKEAEEKLKEIQPEIFEIMGDAEELETDFGTFSIGNRRSWTYSENVQKLEEKIKEQKKNEERLGEAQYVEKLYLIFSSKVK